MAKNDDYLTRTKKQYRLSLVLTLLASNFIIIAGWITIRTELKLSNNYYALILGGAAIATSIIFGSLLTKHLASPITAIWRSVLRINPKNQLIPTPDIDSLRIGRELVANLTMQIFQLSSTNSILPVAKSPKPSLTIEHFITNDLPLPIFVLDPAESIVFANQYAADYINQPIKELIGKNFYMVMDMSFPSENTLDKWLKEVKAATATSTMSWERVRLNVLDNHPTLLFDLAAYYNQENPSDYETLLVLFDHTKQYSQDDQAVGFVALSVHELRTPLTVLRGYIEALEEELGDQINPELTNFLQNMNATAQQLTAFVNNILNVARVDNDQLELNLSEDNWNDVVVSAISSISLRAQVRGITIESNIDPNLPTVGVDRLSIYEVINNLIDNAIKYSGDSKTIKISAHLTKDGLIETNIQDFGLGISPNIMSNLFTKFYRDHRNRSQIGGTGLGLYLCKAIIAAHGGNIWVKSNLGAGSTFSFTLYPYAKLAADRKNNDNKDLIRDAHGWIKNHSLYRR